MRSSLGLDYLSPTQPIGFTILILGVFFSIGILYILLNLDKDSSADKLLKIERQNEQDKKIKSLYPQKK